MGFLGGQNPSSCRSQADRFPKQNVASEFGATASTSDDVPQVIGDKGGPLLECNIDKGTIGVFRSLDDAPNRLHQIVMFVHPYAPSRRIKKGNYIE